LVDAPDNWIHNLIKKYNLTKKQYYNLAVIIRQKLDYAVELGIITKNLMAGIKIDGKRLFRVEKKKPSDTQVFTFAELNKLTEFAWNDFYNNIRMVYKLLPLAGLFQFQTGLRAGELCAVRYEDIENENYIHVQRMYVYRTKKIVQHTKTEYGDRRIYLTTSAKEIIKKCRERQTELGTDSNGYIFSIDGNPLSYNALYKAYIKYCGKIGTIYKSSHKARKTYISALIDGGISINTVREMSGHADERTTYKNYSFDRSPEVERNMKIESALAM
jgi:integrase